MDVRVLVTTSRPDGPPTGTPVVVEIRDTSVMDVASTTICSGRAVTGQPAGGHGHPPDAPSGASEVPGRQVVAAVDLAVPDDVPNPTSLTVWARVAPGDQEHVSAGDWITVQAYPVQSETVVVEVVQV